MITMKAESPRVIICGSMRAWAHMSEVKELLGRRGIDCLMPDTDELSDCSTDAEFDAVKRTASLKHFRHIQDAQTDAVLVVNVAKDGQKDYIGPNAFAEIAIAFASGREVYLLYGTPHTYSDELRAWGARELHGELDVLAADMHGSNWHIAHA